MELVDFTNCRLIPGRTYNGANGKKIAIDYDGALYMLKFPSSGAVKPTELSYTNSCISEHIASTIFNLLGIGNKRAVFHILLFKLAFNQVAHFSVTSPTAFIKHSII